MQNALELIGLIYDSVADASKWPVFLNEFVRVANCHAASLVLFGSSADEHALVTWYGWTDDDVRVHAERYMASDPWAHSSHLEEGSVATTEELCSEEEFEASVAYREFYKPRNTRYGFGGIILRVGGKVSAITAARPAEKGPCGEVEKAVLRPLMPHLRRAALLHGEVCSLRTQLSAFTGHLDRYPHAFLLIDIECGICYANTAARELAELNDGLAIASGRVRLRSSRDDAALRRIVAQIAEDRSASPGRMHCHRPSHRPPYRLLILPVPESGAVAFGASRPAAAIIIIDPGAGLAVDPDALKAGFGLTGAEAKIAAKLAEGRSAEEIAGESGASVQTVRTHIRRILSKTDTNRQGELIALVLRSVPFRRL